MKAIATIFSAAAVMAFFGMATPSQAQFCVGNSIECGLLGAGAGGGLGAAFGGKRGAQTGAVIGGIVGVMQGAENRRRAQQPVYQPRRTVRQRTYRRPARRAPAVSRQLVADVQYSLGNLGYNPGPVDGVAGRGTRAAIRLYQDDNGLLRDGRVTRALLNHLRQSGG